MFRPAYRAATRAAPLAQQQIGRRFASTGPAKRGSFKGTLARWAAAGAVVYYYNTSLVFAEEPHCQSLCDGGLSDYANEWADAAHAGPETSREIPETYSTIGTIAEQRRAQARSNLQSSSSSTSAQNAAQQTVTVADHERPAPAGPGALEEEADQQGAFNEETGEINWDCPCLGGMAHGPCGEQFRAAFSCFVYSKEEPKGVDCIEHFKTMQNCFREHPDIYGAELDDEEVAEVQAEEERAQAARGQSEDPGMADGANASRHAEIERVQQAKSQVRTNEPVSESDEAVPKAWHDGRSDTAK